MPLLPPRPPNHSLRRPGVMLSISTTVIVACESSDSPWPAEGESLSHAASPLISGSVQTATRVLAPSARMVNIRGGPSGCHASSPSTHRRSGGRLFGPTPPPAVAPKPAKSKPALASEFPARILLVEDQPMNQKLAKMMLNKLGYEQVDLAENGKEDRHG